MKRLLFLLGSVALCAADGAPFFGNVTSDQFSPRNDILVQQYSERDAHSHQIWLVSTADPAKRHLLFTHERHAEVVFSNDEKWLVINNHSGSSESELLLYRQKALLEYEFTADLTSDAWHFFDQQNGRTKPNALDHSYVEALRWADDDPPSLLLCLDGHANSRNNTSEWYCLYNVQTKVFSTDLNAHNKKVTKLEPE